MSMHGRMFGKTCPQTLRANMWGRHKKDWQCIVAFEQFVATDFQQWVAIRIVRDR